MPMDQNLNKLIEILRSIVKYPSILILKFENFKKQNFSFIFLIKGDEISLINQQEHTMVYKTI